CEPGARLGARRRTYELLEHPLLEDDLLGGAGECEQPLVAAERVGEGEQLQESGEAPVRGGRSRDGEIEMGPAGLESMQQRLAAELATNVARDGGEEEGEVGGD